MKYVLGKVKVIGDKAVLLAVKEYEDENGKIQKGDDKTIWFPFSQIEFGDTLELNTEAEIEATSWIMGEKDLL